MERRFTLTATKDGLRKRTTVMGYDTYEAKRITGSSEAACQFDATMNAIREIMNRAVDDDVWATGRIRLTDENGVVVHEMEEK